MENKVLSHEDKEHLLPWEDRVKEAALDCMSVGLELYDVHIAYTAKGAKISVFIDKLDDKWGSPTIAECEKFSRLMHLKLEALENLDTSPKFFTLEVSSPGAERSLRSIEDYKRFQGLPMKLQVEEEGQAQTWVVSLKEIQDRHLLVQLADVKFNRNQGLIGKRKKPQPFLVALSGIKKAKLHLDF